MSSIKLHLQTKGQGQPILFIHGLGSSIQDWENQISFFAKSYKTIAVDLRGHGQTGGVAGDYSIALFAQDIATILQDESNPVHVVGISMGGMVALQLAKDFPERVKSLVIINSYVEFSLDDPKMVKALRKRKLIPKLLGMRIMGKVLGKKLFPHKHQGDLRKLIADRWAQNNIKDYIKSVNAIAGWSIKDDLHQIACPVLVLASEFDYQPVEEKKAYTELLPNGQIKVIKGARHAVIIELPDEVNTAVFTFLKS